MLERVVFHSDAPAGLGCWWCAERGERADAVRVVTWGERDMLRDLAAGRAGACMPCSMWVAHILSTHTGTAVMAAAEIEEDAA